MPGANDFWSLSGRPNDFIPSGTRDSSTSGTDTTNQSTSGSSTTSGATSRTNMTPDALAALENLINQLQDRPGISNAELDKQAPLPNIRDYAIYGGNVHDTAGNPSPTGYDYARYNRDLAEAKAKREALIKQSGVIPGGTAEQQRESQNRQSEISADRAQQAGYSKESAFTDAAALSGRFSRQLLEQVMPTIRRAVEGSGTSGGAVAGLLANDAATRVAESQAALGLQTSAQYGAIWNQLASTLETLTRQNNPVLQALLQALGIAKGSVENTNTTQTTNTNQNTTGTVDRNSSTSQQDTGNPALANGSAGTIINQLAQSLGLPSASGGPVANQAGSPYMDITVNRPAETGTIVQPGDTRKQVSGLNQVLDNLVIA